MTTNGEEQQGPYIGPRSYGRRDKAFFFGRESEASEIVSLIIAHKIFLLYSQSGAGKTSLVNVELIPRLEEQEFEILGPVRVKSDITASELTADQNIYVLNVLRQFGGKSLNTNQAPPSTLRGFLERKPPVDEEELPPRAIIFDQFEEIFTSHNERWRDRSGFFEQISEVLASDPLLRVVFVMREDHIAELTPYAPALPGRLQTRFRLERLREDAAISAVRGPLEKIGRDSRFATGVARLLVKELLKVRVQTEQGGSIEVEGEFVEPVQLQVVCQRMWKTRWENLPSDKTDVTAEDTAPFADVDKTLADFYQERIRRVVQMTGLPEEEFRRWFQDKLITPAGTRGQVWGGPQDAAGLPNNAVKALQDLYMVRAEYRAGSPWFELTHDRFIEPIRESNRAWLTAWEAAKKERELLMSKEAEYLQRLSDKQKTGRRAAAVWLFILAIIWLAVLEQVFPKNKSQDLKVEQIAPEIRKIDEVRAEAEERDIIYKQMISDLGRSEYGAIRVNIEGLRTSAAYTDRGTLMDLKFILDNVESEKPNDPKATITPFRAASGYYGIEKPRERFLDVLAGLRKKSARQSAWALKERNKLQQSLSNSWIHSDAAFASISIMWSVLLLGVIFYSVHVRQALTYMCRMVTQIFEKEPDNTRNDGDAAQGFSMWATFLPQLKTERLWRTVSDPFGWTLARALPSPLTIISLCCLMLVQLRVTWLGLEITRQLQEPVLSALFLFFVALTTSVILFWYIQVQSKRPRVTEGA